MTRNEAAEYGKLIGLKPPTYTEKVTMIDTILALKQFETCGNCMHLQNYISDSEVACNLHASFFPLSYGCNKFKPCK